jgi:hypothetical protein
MEWVVTTANAAGTNGLTCLLEIINFGHPSNNRHLQTLLSFYDSGPSALTARSSSSLRCTCIKEYKNRLKVFVYESNTLSYYLSVSINTFRAFFATELQPIERSYEMVIILDFFFILVKKLLGHR